MKRFDHLEEEAVLRVLRSGELSGYIAGSLQGGKEVQALEREWEEYFNVKHAIAVNSATSGLLITSHLFNKLVAPAMTMSACVAVPRMVSTVRITDIEPDYYCIDIDTIQDDESVIAVDLFGQPYDQEINNDHFVIEDASQAIGSTYNGQYAGTLGDIGIYSLNYHKHITCGEGGMVVTNSNLAYRLRMMMNHGEVASRYHGLNLRMTELQAAIARVQLRKLKDFIDARLNIVDKLEKGVKNIVDAYSLPLTRPKSTHVYYLYPIRVSDPQQRAALKTWLKSNSYQYIEGYNVPLHWIFDDDNVLPETERADKELICVKVDPCEY